MPIEYAVTQRPATCDSCTTWFPKEYKLVLRSDNDELVLCQSCLQRLSDDVAQSNRAAEDTDTGTNLELNAKDINL